MTTITWNRKPMAALLPLVLAAALAGCGGGGSDDGDDSTPTNQSPTASAGSDQSVLARADVALNGGGTDADGSIASYAWAQTAGTTVTMNADGAVAAFTAPAVDAQETLSFELTVTDDGGATSTDTVNVTVTPAIAMTAKVYDGPLAGATVTVTVGTETYTALADANGAFELTIGSPDPGTMITIVATGGAGQEHAELISIAGTFGALMNAAGDDGALDATDSSAIDVTNLSTAKAVLMIEANGGAAPSDDAAIEELEKSLDTSAMLELATVIKLVIDEGAALPDGVETTLDLVQDGAATDAVIETAEAAEPGIFSSTLNAILNDPNLTPSFQAGSVPNLYFINRAGYYIYANRGFFLELNDDGSGFVYGNGSALSAALTWTIGETGQLLITIDDSDPLQEYLNCQTTSGAVTCLQTTTALEIRMLSDGAQTDSISVRRLGTVEYPFNPELAARALDSSLSRLGMAPGALLPFTAADVTGTFSVPLSTRNMGGVGAEYETGLLTFNENNTGTRAADGATFEWAIDANGVLGIAFADGDQLDVYWMRDEGDMAIDAMFVMTTAGGDIYAEPTFAVEVDTAMTAGMVQADADGTWNYTGMFDFAYILDSVTSSAIARYYDDAGNTTQQYPAGVAFDGSKFDIISWYDIENDMSVSSCSGVATCLLSYNSSWYPLSEDETGRVFMLEIDDGWYYDAAASADHYRGAKYYHHAQNRWLAPVSAATAGTSGGLQKPAATVATVRGDRVRAALGDTATSH